MNTNKVTRIEVIDEKGRSYVNNNTNNKVELHLQDEDRTLKVIIKKKPKTIKWSADSFQVLKLELDADDYVTKIADTKGKMFDSWAEAFQYHNVLKCNVICQTIANAKGSDFDIDKKPVNDCYTCLFEEHTNEAVHCNTCDMFNKYTNWQSKQDLSNTKIFIGDNPRLSKLVQEKAFELGWSWGKIGTNLAFWRTQSIYFDADKGIGHANAQWYFTKASEKEIFPIDLGIKEEDYKVLLTTSDGVKLYKLDKYWIVREDNSIGSETMTTAKHLNKTIKARFSTKELAEQYIKSLKPKFEIHKWYYCKEYDMHVLFDVTGNNNSNSFVGFNGERWSEEITSKEQMENPNRFGNWIPADMDVVKELLLAEAKRRFTDANNVKTIFGHTLRVEIPFEFKEDNLFMFQGGCLYSCGKWAEVIKKPKSIIKYYELICAIPSLKHVGTILNEEQWCSHLNYYGYNSDMINNTAYFKEIRCNSCKYIGFAMGEEPCNSCIVENKAYNNYVKSNS